MVIRAALFDLGNTLVDYYRPDEFPDVLRRCITDAAAAAEIPILDVDLDALFPQALALNREAADFAVRPLDERLRALFPVLECVPADRMEHVSRAFMQPIFDCARPNPRATWVLDALRACGIRTAVVSNTPWGSPSEFWRAELGRHGLLERVDTTVFCVDTGWRKPHPAPMQRALQVLEVAASDAVFVGDDPRWDVDGAWRAGIRPVLLATKPGFASQNCLVIDRLDMIVELCRGR
jgi:putative hydrolase of the HAD superfamily